MHKTRMITRSTLIWLASAGAVALTSTPAFALGPWENGSSSLQNPELFSGVAIAIGDMNGDCLDDIVRLGETFDLQVELQQEDGSFELVEYGSVEGASWSIAIGDVNGDGINDIFTGGAYNDHKRVLIGSWTETAPDSGEFVLDYELTTLEGPGVFVQCSNFADIDNNGTLDLFVCNDDGISSPYNNDGSGGFTRDLGLINPESTVPSDNSGNYGTVWTDWDDDGDLDLYIARCRQGVNNPMDGRRINNMYRNNGDGTWTDVAEDIGMRPLLQSWSVDFADWDNDGDYDAFLVNHEADSILYENDGQGNYTNVNAASGIEAAITDLEFGIQTHFEDFDNDTFVDLLVTTRTNVHGLFLGNGDGTFTEEVDPFPTGNLGIQSAAVGDVNNDGFPDIIAGFATGFNQPSGVPDRLLINPTNDNNWFNVRLEGTDSNRSAVGAKVEITGAWGTQVREVRSGQSYGIHNSMTRHFGLGDADAIDMLTIRWPSGHVDTAENPDINQTVHIVEGCPNEYYADTDGDGFGDPDSMTTLCLPTDGYVADNTDCVDRNGDVNPDAEEVCDEIDNDCDGQVDEDLDCEPADTGTSEETGGAEDETGGADGETEDADAGQNDAGDGGCGCTAGTPADNGLAALGLFGLLGLTRRRRR